MSNKLRFKLICLLWILAVITVVSVPVLIYSVKFGIQLADEHQRWAEFGSYTAGVYSAMAFLAVALTLYLSQRQQLIHRDREFFYKAVDQLNKIQYLKIKNTDDKAFTTKIVEEFNKNLKNESSSLTRLILILQPSFVPDYLQKRIMSILEDSGLSQFVSYTEFIAELESLDEFDRSERIKVYFGDHDELNETNSSLRSIGSQLFYIIDFELRLHHAYLKAWDMVESRYDEFIDRYLSNLDYLLDLLSKSKEKELLQKYLVASFSKYDIVFVFYACLGHLDKNKELSRAVIDSGLLKKLKDAGNSQVLFYSPSVGEINSELIYVKHFIS